MTAQKVSSRSQNAEPWGAGCRAWRLLAGPDLAVAEEEMPPKTSEIRHVHRHARQLFYVLDGELAMEMPEATITLAAGEALEISPGLPHRACNHSESAIRFLVISSPSTAADRTNLP